MVKNTPVNEGDARHVGLIPGPGRSHGEWQGNPLQYSYLENPMDRRAWWATAHGVTKSWTRLKGLSTHTHLYLTKLNLDGITDTMDMNLSKFWKLVMGREAWHAANHGVTKSWTQLSN